MPWVPLGRFCWYRDRQRVGLGAWLFQLQGPGSLLSVFWRTRAPRCRLSPPPVDPRSIEMEDVVNEEEDYRWAVITLTMLCGPALWPLCTCMLRLSITSPLLWSCLRGAQVCSCALSSEFSSSSSCW